jgi:COMPASS component SWD3
VSRRYCIPAAISHDGRYVIAGSEDHKFVVWDVQTRQAVQSSESHKDVVIAVARHPTRPIIATAGLEKVRHLVSPSLHTSACMLTV